MVMTVQDREDQIARIADTLAQRVDELGGRVTVAVNAEVDFYGSNDVVSFDQLLISCPAHVRFVFAGLRLPLSFDTAPASATGTARAEAGVPLSAVMAAYRGGSHRMWQALFELADHPHNFAAKDMLLATSRIWHAQDIFTEAMVATYRQRSTELARADEVERAALTEALLQGRTLGSQTLWDIAALLRVPAHGPYVIVAAEAATVGKQALHGIGDKLRSLDVFSAWRLLPDVQVGIVRTSHPNPATNT